MVWLANLVLQLYIKEAVVRSSWNFSSLASDNKKKQ